MVIEYGNAFKIKKAGIEPALIIYNLRFLLYEFVTQIFISV